MNIYNLAKLLILLLNQQVLNTLRLIFLSIRSHDEESQTVHIPLFMTNVLGAIDVSELVTSASAFK